VEPRIFFLIVVSCGSSSSLSDPSSIAEALTKEFFPLSDVQMKHYKRFVSHINIQILCILCTAMADVNSGVAV
jgi:hypothetical protein